MIKKNILGISCFYHDSSATILQNNNIIAAFQEERITRKKFDNSFPIHSINYCLEYSNLEIEDIDIIAFYEDPNLKFDRIIKTLSFYKPLSILNNSQTINKCLPPNIKWQS